MNEQQLESELQAKGLNAPRVTPDHIDSIIVSEHYFTADCANRLVVAGKAKLPHGLSQDESNPEVLSLLTFCVLVLKSGFTVTGESACVSPENFDPQVGIDIARKNAREKIWALEGYLLREKLSAV